MKTKEKLFDARVVMLCDDTQIDRRIMQEAVTLREAGCEVIVVGRAVSHLPMHEIVDGIKIERIDAMTFIAPRETREQVTTTFTSALHNAIKGEAAPQPESGTQKTLTDTPLLDVPFPDYGPPWLDEWTKRQSWMVRNLVRALVWPPFRLEALYLYFPVLGRLGCYALYLPTLLLTPRPLALRWHWARLRYQWQILSKKISSKSFWDKLKIVDANVVRAKLSRPEDMNIWEQAILERGRFYRADIIHVHDLPQLRPAAFLSQELGVPLIYDSHELYPQIATLAPAQQKKLRVIEDHFIKLADHVVSPNPFFAKIMAKEYGIKIPTVILNAAEWPEGFSKGERSNKLRQAIGLGPEARILLFQGWGTIKDRGLGDLVRGLAYTQKNIHLALMIYSAELKKLGAIAKESGVADRVHFVATVPQNELLWWVASADAGIIPYKPVDTNSHFCSPNKLFEFIAAGLPIIANDLPYLRQIVDGNGFGLVCRFNGPKDYAAAINKAFGCDAPTLDEWRKCILEKQEGYMWASQENILLGLYKELLAPAETASSETTSSAHAA